MNLVLIGDTGTETVEVAKLLAQRLGRRCCFLQEKLAERSGVTAGEILEQVGTARFDALLGEVIGELTWFDNLVVLADAAAVERLRNQKLAAELFWLIPPAPEASRAGHDLSTSVGQAPASIADAIMEIWTADGEASLPPLRHAEDSDLLLLGLL